MIVIHQPESTNPGIVCLQERHGFVIDTSCASIESHVSYIAENISFFFQPEVNWDK